MKPTLYTWHPAPIGTPVALCRGFDLGQPQGPVVVVNCDQWGNNVDLRTPETCKRTTDQLAAWIVERAKSPPSLVMLDLENVVSTWSPDSQAISNVVSEAGRMAIDATLKCDQDATLNTLVYEPIRRAFPGCQCGRVYDSPVRIADARLAPEKNGHEAYGYASGADFYGLDIDAQNNRGIAGLSMVNWSINHIQATAKFGPLFPWIASIADATPGTTIDVIRELWIAAFLAGRGRVMFWNENATQADYDLLAEVMADIEQQTGAETIDALVPAALQEWHVASNAVAVKLGGGRILARGIGKPVTTTISGRSIRLAPAAGRMGGWSVA
jgi:hypothetical protein